MPINGIKATSGGMATGPQQITTAQIPGEQPLINPVITVPSKNIIKGGTINNLENLVKGTWLQHSSLIEIPTDANATAGTVILNVPMLNGYVSKVARLYMLMADRFMGCFDYRLTVYGASTIIGGIEVGTTLYYMENPTINDLRIIEGKTVAANDTNVYTFTLGPIVPDDGIQRDFFPTHDQDQINTFADPSILDWQMFPHFVMIQNVPLKTNISGNIDAIRVRIESRLSPDFMTAVTNIRRLENIFDTITATSENSAVQKLRLTSLHIADFNNKTLGQIFEKERLYVSKDGIYTYNNSNLSLSNTASSTTEKDCYSWDTPLVFQGISSAGDVTYAIKTNPTVVTFLQSTGTYVTSIIGDATAAYAYTILFHPWDEVRPIIIRVISPGTERYKTISIGFVTFENSRTTKLVDLFEDVSPQEAFSDADIIQLATGNNNNSSDSGLWFAIQKYCFDNLDPYNTINYTDFIKNFSKIFDGTYNFLKTKVASQLLISVQTSPWSIAVGNTTLTKTVSSKPTVTKVSHNFSEAGLNIIGEQGKIIFTYGCLLATEMPYFADSPGMRFKAENPLPKLEDFTYTTSEYIVPPQYTLFTKVPENYVRIIVTENIPQNVSPTLAKVGLPTSASLQPNFPELDSNKCYIFDLVSPQNSQTIMKCCYSGFYKAFFATFDDSSLYATYNTHDAASLLIRNIGTYYIGNFPSKSISSSFLNREVTPIEDNVLLANPKGPTIQTIPRELLLSNTLVRSWHS